MMVGIGEDVPLEAVLPAAGAPVAIGQDVPLDQVLPAAPLAAPAPKAAAAPWYSEQGVLDMIGPNEQVPLSDTRGVAETAAVSGPAYLRNYGKGLARTAVGMVTHPVETVTGIIGLAASPGLAFAKDVLGATLTPGQEQILKEAEEQIAMRGLDPRKSLEENVDRGLDTAMKAPETIALDATALYGPAKGRVVGKRLPGARHISEVAVDPKAAKVTPREVGASLVDDAAALRDATEHPITSLRTGAADFIDSGAKKLASAGLKPSKAKSKLAKAPVVIEEFLNQKDAAITRDYLEDLQGKITDADRVKSEYFAEKRAAGETVPIVTVESIRGPIKEKIAQAGPDNLPKYQDELAKLDALLDEAAVVDPQTGVKMIAADAAQGIKMRFAEDLKTTAYGKEHGGTIEGKKAVVRGLKEAIAGVEPEFQKLNTAESRLITLRDALETAVGNAESNNPLGITSRGAGALAGAAGYMHGGGVEAAAAAAATAFLLNQVESRVNLGKNAKRLHGIAERIRPKGPPESTMPPGRTFPKVEPPPPPPPPPPKLLGPASSPRSGVWPPNSAIELGEKSPTTLRDIAREEAIASGAEFTPAPTGPEIFTRQKADAIARAKTPAENRAAAEAEGLYSEARTPEQQMAQDLARRQAAEAAAEPTKQEEILNQTFANPREVQMARDLAERQAREQAAKGLPEGETQMRGGGPTTKEAFDAAEKILGEHKFLSIREAYEWMNDDRSHGDQYLAAGAQEVFPNYDKARRLIGRDAQIKEFIADSIQKADDLSIADGEGPYLLGPPPERMAQTPSGRGALARSEEARIANANQPLSAADQSKVDQSRRFQKFEETGDTSILTADDLTEMARLKREWPDANKDLGGLPEGETLMRGGGPTTKEVTAALGKIREMWHGSRSGGFVVFDISKAEKSWGPAMFFTNDKAYAISNAEAYGAKNPTLMRVQVDPGKSFDPSANAKHYALYKKWATEVEKSGERGPYGEFVYGPDEAGVGDKRVDWRDQWWLSDKLKNEGYDSYVTSEADGAGNGLAILNNEKMKVVSTESLKPTVGGVKIEQVIPGATGDVVRDTSSLTKELTNETSRPLRQDSARAIRLSSRTGTGNDGASAVTAERFRQEATLRENQFRLQKITTIEDAVRWLSERDLYTNAKHTPDAAVQALINHPDFQSLSVFDRARLAAQLQRNFREREYSPELNVNTQNLKTADSPVWSGDTIRGCDQFCYDCYAVGGANQATISHQVPIRAELVGELPSGKLMRIGTVGEPAKDWAHTGSEIKKLIDRSVAAGHKVSAEKNVYVITKLLTLDGLDTSVVKNFEVSLDPIYPAHLRQSMANVQRLIKEHPEVNVALRIRSLVTNNPQLQAAMGAAVDFANAMNLPVLETRMRFKSGAAEQILEIDPAAYHKQGPQFKVNKPVLKSEVNKGKYYLCDESNTGRCDGCLNCQKLMSTERDRHIAERDAPGAPEIKGTRRTTDVRGDAEGAGYGTPGNITRYRELLGKEQEGGAKGPAARKAAKEKLKAEGMDTKVDNSLYKKRPLVRKANP